MRATTHFSWHTVQSVNTKPAPVHYTRHVNTRTRAATRPEVIGRDGLTDGRHGHRFGERAEHRLTLTAGDLMSTDTPHDSGPETLAELTQRAEMVRDRIRHVAAEVKALLAEDLPKYVEREMKRGFVEHPDFASRLTDGALRDLKTAVRTEGEHGRDQVLAALDDEALWFPTGPLTEGRASVADSPGLWAAVGGITGTVRALRERFHYPPSLEPIEYKPPSWFIGRRYLPTLSEKYWRLIAELRELDTLAQGIKRDTSRSVLTKRWDATEE
jgi:hypothetical protein